MKNEIYTIGYSSFSIEDFVNTLRHYGITMIADVRSSPYSRFRPDFRKDALQRHLADSDIACLFLGNLLGARIKHPEVYKGGKLSYALLSNSDFWKQGIDQLMDEAKTYRLALMCAEKDPINCHRTFLVSRTLRLSPVRILHILHDGSLEEHAVTEKRLLALHNLDQPDIFRSQSVRIEDVYDSLCESITI